MRNDLPNENASNFGARIRETLMTYLGKQGDPLDRGVTLRDLVQSGFVTLTGAKIGGGPVGLVPGTAVAPDTYEPDLTPPPTPSGFTLSSGITSVFVEHDIPTYTQGHGHLRTRVYGVIVAAGDPLPTFNDAEEISQFSGAVFAYATQPSTTWRMWIKWESVDGVLSPSPAGGTNGVAVTTGEDVTLLVEAMTGPGNPFTILETTTVIGGVSFPAGTYSTNAFILDAQITNAKIANAAIDDAKIANLSASKITAGTIAADRLDANTITSKVLTVDWAKITNASVTSAQIASAAIGSAQIANTLQSTNYSSSAGWQINKDGTATFNEVALRGAINGGSHTGYAWPSSGTGFHLGPNGLLLGNYNTGKYFQVEASGNVYAPGFTIVNGSATFYGALGGASGTFSGALSGASGTFSGSLTAQVVNTENLVGAAVTSGYSATTSGSSVSLTVAIPANASSVVIVAYLGQPYSYLVGGGKDAYYQTGIVYGTLYVDGVATATQSGTLVWSSGAIAAGSHTFSITRNQVTDSMNFSVLVNKR